MARRSRPRPRPRPAHIDSLQQRVAREKGIERVAVIFTHGQGEQSPMRDVTELAESLWVTNDEVRKLLKESGGVWSVPVFDGDMSEQRRLVTGVLPGMGRGGRDLQVDFYQFYWADLMTGNRFKHLWRWFQRLMKRRGQERVVEDAPPPAPKPAGPGWRGALAGAQAAVGAFFRPRQRRTTIWWDETPPALRDIRRFAMRVGFVVALFGTLYAAATIGRLATVEWRTWSNLYAVLMTGALAYQINLLVRPASRTRAMLSGLVLTLVSLVLGGLADGLAAGALLVETWDTPLGNAYEVALNIHHLFTTILLVLIVAMGRIAYLAYNSFLVPVMADSARMFSPDPENIPNRDRIRKRGMELLEAIHSSERRYDRVVMLAHSLGTAVAYNVLAQYWGNVHRLFNHAKVTAEQQAVEEAGHKLKSEADEAARAQLLVDYRAKVRAYQRALMAPGARLPRGSVEWRTADFTSTGQLLRKVSEKIDGRRPTAAEYLAPWRITDFVTCGSPLTYARLLLADRDSEFMAAIDQRAWPTSPPHIRPGETSFAYNSAPHHAALFGVTCWTNLYFPVEPPAKGDLGGRFIRWLTGASVKGDIVGGPIAGPTPKGLGRGILDVPVQRAKGMPDFAHSEYWRWPEGSKPEEDPVPQHLEVLRRAVRLIEDGSDQDATLTALSQAPRAPA